jgi:hypothetical protein
VAGTLDQLELQPATDDMTGLADAVPTEPDEIGRLSLESHQEVLSPFQLGRERIRQGEEGIAHQSPPPKTATSRNRQGGEAWPTWIIWLGSPLPQESTPCSSKLSASPTPARLRQKAADTPR